MKLLVRRLFWGLGIAAILGLIAYGFVPQPVPVDLAAATVGPLRVTVDQQGKTRVKQRYIIASPLGGQLSRIPWKPGQKIYQGSTVLATIQPKETEFLDPSAQAQAQAKVKACQSMCDKANASVRQMKVKLEFAQRDRERLQPLASQRSSTQQELDTAMQAERSANEELRVAQQAVKAAEFDLEQARAVLLRTRAVQDGMEVSDQFEIVSPINGRVLKVEQESATVISAGMALIEIGDPSDLEVAIDVLSPDAVKVPVGARMLLEHWGGEKPLEARVRVVEPYGFTKVSALGVEEQRVYVVADIVDPISVRPSLGDGYRVEARIIIWEKADALKVPAGAMSRQGTQWAVFVVEAGKAKLRPVTVGRSNGLETEILAGLSEGEQVIVHAGDRVKEGVAVTPRP
jgi:HlyD family secretion protein